MSSPALTDIIAVPVPRIYLARDMHDLKKRLFVIAFSTFALVGSAQEMVLYTIPSPRPLNWRSPHTLFMSYIENLAVHTGYPHHRHPLGHLMIELRDTAHYALAGLVAESRAEMFNSVTKERYGMGALFTIFKGKMETGADNYHQLIDRYPKGDIAYIKFLLSPRAFSRLWQYMLEYSERGYDKKYNGRNKPREGEGAGCSAFAMSFVELAGLLDTTITNPWLVKVNVQNKLIGGPQGGYKTISTWRLAFTQRWADTARQAYHPLSYYEPRWIYNWILNEWNKPAEGNHIKYGVQRRQAAKGLVIDCSNIPTPTDDIWHTP